MSNRYQLLKQEGRLALYDLNEEFKPIAIDFVDGQLNHRRTFRGKELIAKAVGIKKDNLPHVIDATAGLGRDAFILASLGCTVSLIERSDMMHQLLADGLARASEDESTREIVARMRLYHGDAKAYFTKLEADVIYCDPMYPERKKSALVKKEMRILRAINGADDDCADLLQAAVAAKVKRVVVKRPKGAENLAELAPNFSYNGKHTRFDVYAATLSQI